MKKLLALALVVFGLAACQTEPEGFDVTVNGEVPVTVTVDLADAVGTRADSAEGAIDNGVVTSNDYTLRYALQVFNENGTASKDIKYKYTDATSVAFDLRLVPNRNYKFVVWADIVDANQTLTEDVKCADLHYAIGADLRNITLNNSIIAWEAMDETRDAYTGVYNANNFNAAQNITINLTRPFAKLRVVTTDIAELFDGVVPDNAVATYTTKHRTSFDAFAKKAGEATLQGVQHTFDIAGYNEGDDADTENNKTLFVDYFFAADQDDVVNFTLDVKEANGTTIKKNTFNTPIPVKRNYLTTIKGNVLTEGNKISIDIDDNFGENQENQENWGTISSQAELDAAVENGGKYIVIAHLDINNSGAGTTAVRFAATGAAVETIIDLNGYTITAKNTGTDALITVADGNTLTFTGEGNVILTSDSTGALIDNNGTVNIDGGTFTNNSTNSDTKLIENSNTAVVNVTGGSIDLDEEVDGGATTDYLALLAEAFANGGVYELPTDVTLSEPLTLAADKTLTLNLNGKTIKHVKECTGHYTMICNKGNLTITGDGKISFTDTGAGDPTHGWGSYTLRNEGTLVVENGVIEHLGEQNKGNGQHSVHMYCAIDQQSGSSTINGGRISTPTYRSARLWKGNMTINGGDFEGQLWVQAADNSANLTINGGTFAPRGIDSSSVFVTNASYDVACAITGGFFNTKIGMSKPLACINGGTFTATAAENTNPALLAEGYDLVQEGDVWVVTPSYTVEGNVYTIYTANGLAHFSEFKAPNGAVFNLAADIDMKGKDFKAIAAGYDKSLTFNGNNHTISNVNILENSHNSVGSAGMFFCYPGGTININDLTIDGATIENATYAGTVFGYTQGAATLKNVHVKNSNINGVKKVGGFVGFVEASTSKFVAEDCSVINTTVTATEKQAATVIGYAAKPTTFKNITVENSTAEAPKYCLNDVVCDDPAQALIIVNDVAYVFNANSPEEFKKAVNEASYVRMYAGNYTIPDGSQVILKDKARTIIGSKDVIIDCSKIDARDQYVTGATLKFENVTLNFGKANYMGFANTASLTYKDCNINGLQFLFGPNVVFENCDLNSNGAEHTVWTYGVKNVSFTDCDFTYGDRGVNCYSDNDVEGGKQTVNFTNCTFATDNSKSEGAVEINSCFFSVGIEVNLTGCTAPAYGQMAYVSPWDSTNGAKTTINIK